MTLCYILLHLGIHVVIENTYPMHLTIHYYINCIWYVVIYMINMNVIYISNEDLLYKSCLRIISKPLISLQFPVHSINDTVNTDTVSSRTAFSIFQLSGQLFPVEKHTTSYEKKAYLWN